MQGQMKPLYEEKVQYDCLIHLYDRHQILLLLFVCLCVSRKSKAVCEKLMLLKWMEQGMLLI